MQGGGIMQTKIVDKAYSFRIIPNKEQEELINKNIGCVRFVFNHFLAQSKNDKYLSYSKFAAQLPKLKKEYNWLKEVDSISLQQSLKDLDKAFKRFFKGLGGFPKFKSKKIISNPIEPNISSVLMELKALR